MICDQIPCLQRPFDLSIYSCKLGRLKGLCLQGSDQKIKKKYIKTKSSTMCKFQMTSIAASRIPGHLRWKQIQTVVAASRGLCMVRINKIIDLLCFVTII